ncbi:UNKNOWN [Stylonychia lemnae]|uniref:EF-hand domain-containing protein n=1 Tax=Stylonychia lemnae TaxID=5949 RepID=A0A078AMI4_STYLE|nr:UNKNOWN [Stylonychia lemnae]|eukprot:CDW83131.1 UNKNOWN [Stylonychia lemnae]
MRSKDQDFEKQKALLQQKINLYQQEIQELEEKEQSQKRLYDKMISALDQSDSNKITNDEIQEYQRKISDLELELEKSKSEYKMRILMLQDDLNTERQILMNLRQENDLLNLKVKEMQSSYEIQITEKNLKIKQLEESLLRKDEQRRQLLDLKEQDHQGKLAKLLQETKDKLDQLQNLKQTELECQKQLFDQKYLDLKVQNDEENQVFAIENANLKTRITEMDEIIKEKERQIEKLKTEQSNQIQIGQLASQFEQFRLQSQEGNGKYLQEKEELRQKADKMEKLYIKTKAEFKTQLSVLEMNNKQLTSKIQSQQIVVDQMDVIREELKKYKKIVNTYKEKDSKFETKIKDQQKVYLEQEDNLKKDLEIYKSQNKKLKVEIEQIKIMSAKVKDDIEKLKLDHIKEISNYKQSIEKLRSKLKRYTLSSQNNCNNPNTVINASITLSGNQQNIQFDQENQPYYEDMSEYQSSLALHKYNKHSQITQENNKRDNLGYSKHQPYSSTLSGNNILISTNSQTQKNVELSRQKSAGKLTSKAQSSKTFNLSSTNEQVNSNSNKGSLIETKPMNNRNKSPLSQIMTDSNIRSSTNMRSSLIATPKDKYQLINNQSNNRNQEPQTVSDYMIKPQSNKMYDTNQLAKSISQLNFGLQNRHRMTQNFSMVDSNLQTSILPSPYEPVQTEHDIQHNKMEIIHQDMKQNHYVDQVKSLKKEIQKLVTVLMQKEGKLPENQKFTNGQFVIKVHNKNKKKKKDITVDQYEDATMVVDELSEDLNLLDDREKKDKSNRVLDQQGYSPRQLFNIYPSLSPRGIFDKFN